MATKKATWINPIFLLIFAILCCHGASTSTIRLGDELNSTSLLISQGNNFTLGFFMIDDTNYSYIGIWYTNDEQAKRAWVANPNAPFVTNTAVLKIDNTTGKLVIAAEGRIIFNVSDQGVTRDTSATLEDSGNLVLRDEVENRIVWQSFDHPNNALLPGMKLGYNVRSGQNWSLISWLSDEILANGAFSLSWDPDSKELVIRRRGELYWSSGVNESQKLMVNLGWTEYNYSLITVDNAEEKYFAFGGINEPFPMWFLNPEGKIIDSGGRHLSVPEFCYGYQLDNGVDDGCAETGFPTCRRRNDKFEFKNGDFFSAQTTISYDDNSSIGLSDCMENCWNNCDCVGFITSGNGTGCIIWTGSNEFRINEQGTSVSKYLFVRKISSKVNKKIWIATFVPISLVLLIVCALCYLWRRKIKRAGEEKKRRDEYLQVFTASESFKNGDEIENDKMDGHDLNILEFASVLAATNNFSSENKLGEGGFGPVYKGKLTDGRKIAIKRLSRTSGQGLVEFKNELILITRLQHTNLVRVLGCCIHGEEKMLIYEYMPNKSLDIFLFDQNRRALLDWQKRFNIIEGVAQGLLYLHKYSRMRVIHRDLKVSNVLLDENMNPKISDFGMARIFKQNETEAMTKRVVGTYGYMSPEYAMEGTFSIKSDVFSFGVLVLEIVSGRKNTSFYHLDQQFNLIGYGWELWKEGTSLALMDPTLSDSCVVPQVLRTIHVGLLCVQDNATDRPTMLDVVSLLSNESVPLPAPKQPAFLTGTTVLESSSHQGTANVYSANYASITATEPR
ncbi:hypothetical protein LguiB_009437 [Lonicera macranthoides]